MSAALVIVRNINVLVGGSEAAHSVVFQSVIRERFKDTASVNFTLCDRLVSLLAQASRQRYDVCVLVLESVLGAEDSHQSRIEALIAAIPSLKTRNPMPVIALSAYCPNSDFPAHVRRAGADAFLPLPLDEPAFLNAVARYVGACPAQIGACPSDVM